jgi:very-short-patch-repair endonuclease
MWRILRNDALGYRFRRQYPVGKYTLDFFCPARKLALEIDGEQHFETLQADRERDAELKALGIRVLRIPSLDIFDTNQLAMVAWVKIIREELEREA